MRCQWRSNFDRDSKNYRSNKQPIPRRRCDFPLRLCATLRELFFGEIRRLTTLVSGFLINSSSELIKVRILGLNPCFAGRATRKRAQQRRKDIISGIMPRHPMGLILIWLRRRQRLVVSCPSWLFLSSLSASSPAVLPPAVQPRFAVPDGDSQDASRHHMRGLVAP